MTWPIRWQPWARSGSAMDYPWKIAPTAIPAPGRIPSSNVADYVAAFCIFPKIEWWSPLSHNFKDVSTNQVVWAGPTASQQGRSARWLLLRLLLRVLLRLLLLRVLLRLLLLRLLLRVLLRLRHPHARPSMTLVWKRMELIPSHLWPQMVPPRRSSIATWKMAAGPWLGRWLAKLPCMTVAGWCFEYLWTISLRASYVMIPSVGMTQRVIHGPFFLGVVNPQLGWLRAFKNEQNLETPQITSATWASIPAVDLAVNHATQVRLSNEDFWLVRSLENQQPIKKCKFQGGKKSIAGSFDSS